MTTKLLVEQLQTFFDELGNLENTCRLCAKSNREQLNIFSKKNTADKITTCLGIQVSRNDKLPQNICVYCKKLLDMVYVFREQCQEVDVALHFWVSTSMFGKEEDMEDEEDDGESNSEAENDSSETKIKRKSFKEKVMPPLLSDIKKEVYKIMACEKDFEDEERMIGVNIIKKEIKVEKSDTEEFETSVPAISASKEIKEENASSMSEDDNDDGEDDTSASQEKKPLLKDENNQHEESENSIISDKAVKNSNNEDSDVSNSEKQYKCLICKKEFKNLTCWERHNLLHAGNSKFKCKDCDKMFLSQIWLDSHMLKHEKKMMLKDAKRIRQEERKIRQEEKKIKQEEEKMMREEAKKTKEDIKKLNKDTKKLTEDGDANVVEDGDTSSTNTWLPCTICHKKFKSEKFLNRHTMCHTGNAKYKCTLCSRGFLAKGWLDIHVAARHSQKRIFKCKDCGKSFIQKMAYLKHLKEESLKKASNKTFKCDICWKRFTSKKHFFKHLLIHTDIQKKQQ